MSKALSLPEQIDLQEALKIQSDNIELLTLMLEQSMGNTKLALDLADAQRWRPITELNATDKMQRTITCRAGDGWVDVLLFWPDGCWTDEFENPLPEDELPTHFMTVPAIPGK